MKIWSKEGAEQIDALVEAFTVGSDRDFDLVLAPYDVQGSLAHIKMLHSVGLLSETDYEALSGALQDIAEEIREGRFHISSEVEDVHSQIEFLLTERLGDAGKRVHTGRSRNDQVAVNLKLFLRDEVLSIKTLCQELFDVLLALSETHRHVLLPGYTHLQAAMPSSFGLWYAAWAECLVDDMELLAAAYAVVNKNPLGSAAGYGSSLPLDRQMTTDLLDFRAMHYNVIAAQMSRGRTEKIVAEALSSIAGTLARMAMDICLYVSQDYDFLQFPDALTTGSSIMPHKKNPDIFELVRGRCNRIQALPNELTLLLSNLPSGYHRDLQLTKEILFPGIADLKSCLKILAFALPQGKPRGHILDNLKYRFLFSVESVHALVREGLPFREAYQKVGKAIADGSYAPTPIQLEDHQHQGAMGNLMLAEIRALWEVVSEKF